MTLADMIDRQTAEIQALFELLESERSAVADRDLAALEALTADKHACLASIERTERECRASLAAAGFTEDRDGMDRAVAQAEDTDLPRRWQELQSRLATLRRHNERNGLAIQRSIALVEEELTLLRGQPAGAGTYDAAGRRAGDDRSRPLTRA